MVLDVLMKKSHSTAACETRSRARAVTWHACVRAVRVAVCACVCVSVYACACVCVCVCVMGVGMQEAKKK